MASLLEQEATTIHFNCLVKRLEVESNDGDSCTKCRIMVKCDKWWSKACDKPLTTQAMLDKFVNEFNLLKEGK